MGKRSSFERNERDLYPTPPEAVAPLLPHLAPGTRFVEPCAGDGRLADELVRHGHVCMDATDIEPLAAGIRRADALGTKWDCGDAFITNPPWLRTFLHPLIIHLSDQAPTWLLFDADWMHTKQAAPFKSRLRRVVSVGRVKWIPDSKMTGKDNAAWYLFDAPDDDAEAIFYLRAAERRRPDTCI